VLTTVPPMVWDAFLGEHRLIDATGLGTWAGAVYGFVVLDLGVYVWHRTLHGTPLPRGVSDAPHVTIPFQPRTYEHQEEPS
jgi:sterol desaturase/sphingolipid hydroxylase (fatty acid hydroxylase superfamily)